MKKIKLFFAVMVMLALSVAAAAQNISVKGTVKDAAGENIVGTSIIKGKSRERLRYEERLPYIREQLAKGVTIGQLARRLKVHRNTLSRYLQETKKGNY